MKDSSPPKWILIVGFSAIALVFVLYSIYFGPFLSHKHSTWAEFGSFFGGLLGPLLAFLAIVMLYHTLVTQLTEFKASVTYLSEAAKVAAQDFELSKMQTMDNETLSVLAKRLRGQVLPFAPVSLHSDQSVRMNPILVNLYPVRSQGWPDRYGWSLQVRCTM